MPKDDSGTISVHNRLTLCQTSPAPSSVTPSTGAASRGECRPARNQVGSARGSRTADPDISVAMNSFLSPN